MVMGGVCDIRNFLKKMPYTVRVGNIPGGMSEFIETQDAINYCDQQTGDWTIEVYTGAYAEGDLTSTGAANITLRGMGDNRVEIALGAAPAAAMIVVAAGTMTLENLEISAFDANQPPLRVTGGVCRLVNCLLNGFAPPGNSIEQVGGTIHMDRCEISDGTIDMRDADCTIYIHHCQMSSSGDIIETADGGGVNVIATVIMDHTDCNGGTFTLAATGACIYFFEFITGMANINDASLLGTSTMRECQVGGTGLIITGTSDWNLLGGRCASVSNADGTGVAEVTIIGGIVQGYGRAQGSIVWWQDDNTLKVMPCTTITDTIIQWAIAAAGAGDVILAHSGTYEEAVTLAAGIDLRGIGPKGAVVIQQTDASVITLATNVQLQNFTVRIVTPTAGRRLIIDNGVACIARMTDLIFEITTPSNHAHRLILLTGAGTYTFERCSEDIGGTGVIYGILNATNPAIIYLIDNNFNLSNPQAFHIRMDIAGGVWHSKGNRWTGTCGMFDNDGGTWYGDNDPMLCTGAWLNTGSTMTLRNCAIEAPVVAGNDATVRMKDCSYRAIQRTGIGNIVDESPDLKDAPWHIERWTWQAALANSQVAVRGVPLDAGSGQIIIETLDSGAGVMAVETNPELARALGNEFTPARTPRFLTQISAYTDNASGAGNPAFDPHVSMFYGLRETLGNALPVHPEHHAGFIWTGAAFNASSNDGVATQTTALTTPSDDAQHQLEVIVFGGLKVEFYVDGVLVATHSTRIPTAVLDWQHIIIGLTTGGGDTISVTVRNGGTQECPS